MGLLWDYYGIIYGIHYGIIKQSSSITIMSPYFLGFWEYLWDLGNYVWNYDDSHMFYGNYCNDHSSLQCEAPVR